MTVCCGHVVAVLVVTVLWPCCDHAVTVSPPVQIDELEDHKIQTWRDITDSHRPRVLLSIDPTASLFDATQMLLTEKIHRLPVIDNESGNALSILTLKRILWYMRSVFPWTELPVLMSMTVKELNIVLLAWA